MYLLLRKGYARTILCLFEINYEKFITVTFEELELYDFYIF